MSKHSAALGHTIAAGRKARFPSQLKAAWAVGISATYLDLLERGLSLPSSSVLENLCREFALPFDDLKRLVDKAALARFLEARQLTLADMEQLLAA